MNEVSFAGEDHRDTCLVGCLDYFSVSDRATGLHDCGAASFDGGFEAVLEGEERI